MEPQSQLMITLHKNGSVSVQGAVENKAACYGLLEAAKDAIREHHARVAAGTSAPGIAVPSPDFSRMLLKRSMSQGG